MPVEMMRAGDRGLLIGFGPGPAALLHGARRRAREVAGVTACVAGEQSLLVLGAASESWLRAAIERTDADVAAESRLHRVEVSFAGEYALDLPELLAHAGLVRDTFLTQVAGLRFTARHLGFRAGFAYLEGWPEEWRLPRRSTARPRVPAGTFAIAGTMAGFYPIDSPGGWNLLGRTNASLWDSEREPPNRIAAGDTVELMPTLGRIEVSTREPRDAPRGLPFAEVVAAGQLTMIVGVPDEARLELGLATGGAFDAEAAAIANLAIGNAPDACVLECALTGPTLRFIQARRCAWRGADAELRVDGVIVGSDFQLGAGQTLTIGRLHGALRGWLAISGGIDSMAPRYAVTPHVVRRGEFLHDVPLESGHPSPPGDPRHTPVILVSPPQGSDRLPARLHALAGPHPIAGDLLRRVAQAEWQVTPLLDRVGVRLRSLTPIESDLLASSGSLPSCGAQFGTVQWHPNGELVILGPDHPVTGGYLQPFTLRESERWKVARLLPGDLVRWVFDQSP